MPNQRRIRKIDAPPKIEGFKPVGIKMRQLDKVVLLYEEYESIRLIDYENMNQEEAAERMNISRPTFTRIYKKARQAIAKAMVEGKAIIIEGGTYTTENYWARCKRCSRLTTAATPLSHCPHCHSSDLNNLHQPE